MTSAAPPDLHYISYEEYLSGVRAVMAAVRANAWLPDFVVGVGRGGLAPAVFISHGLSVPMLSVDHSTKLAGFADELLAKLAGLAREGRKLLFVDDINDSGSTVTYIREMLAKQGALAENVRFAVLINNICSRARVDYWSREIDRNMHKDWFVFPWEAMGTRDALIDDANAVPERLR